MANKSFRANLELDTQLNITDVLTKINKLKQTLISKGTSRSAFAGIEKSLAYVESVMTRLNKYEMSGFANLGEIEKYNNMVQQVEISLNGVISSLSSLSGNTLDINTQQFNSKIKQINTDIEKLQKNINKFFTELKGAQLTIDEETALRKAMNTGDLEEAKRLYQDILSTRQKQVKTDQSSLDLKERDLEKTKQQLAAEKAISDIQSQRIKSSTKKNATYDYSSKGAELAGITSGKFSPRRTNIDGEIASRWALYRGYEAVEGSASEATRRKAGQVKDSEGNWIKIKNEISTEGYKVIQDTYLEVIKKMLNNWTKASSNNKPNFSANEVIKQVNEALKRAFNYSLDASEQLKKYIETDWQTLISSLSRHEASVKIPSTDKTVSAVKEAQSATKTSKQKVSTLTSGQATLEDLTSQSAILMQESTKAISERDAAVKQAKTDEAAMQKEISATSEVLKRNTEAQYANTKSLYALGEEQLSIGQEFENVRSYVQSLLSVTAIFHQVISLIKTTWDEAKNLDDAFASIAMVSDYSVQEMWNIYDQYNQMAQELGQSTESVVKSSALFIQQG